MVLVWRIADDLPNSPNFPGIQYFSENYPGVNPVVMNYKIRYNKNRPLTRQVRYSLACVAGPLFLLIFVVAVSSKMEKHGLDM